MLDKNVDVFCLGKSYLSFLYSLTLLNKGKKVLLVNDGKHGYGPMYAESFSLLEKNVLETWGMDRNIAPLQKLSNFLEEKPLIFIIDNIQIKLGGEPFQNLVELMRKFPGYFYSKTKTLWNDYLTKEGSREEFNNLFKLYVNRLGKTLFRFKTEQNISFNVFEEDCPKILLELFQSFSQFFFSSRDLDSVENWRFRGFIYLARGYHQDKLSISGSLFELFHTFLSLLSPHYILNQNKLNIELLDLLQMNGGKYKNTYVKNWVFNNGKPWSLELGTYEGVIQPKSISLLTSYSYDPRIQIDSSRKYYRSFRQKLEFSHSNVHSWNGARVICSRVDRMGTNCPFWYGDFMDNKAQVETFYYNQIGLKKDFIEKDFSSMVESDLKQWMPKNERIIFSECSDGSEILKLGRSKILIKNKVEAPLIKGPNVLHIIDPNKSSKLRKVQYLGPYSEGPLGLLSSIISLKDQYLYA